MDVEALLLLQLSSPVTVRGARWRKERESYRHLALSVLKHALQSDGLTMTDLTLENLCHEDSRLSHRRHSGNVGSV